MSGWNPIETAPVGTMLLFCSMTAVEARHWCFVDWLAGSQRQLTLHPKHDPTHWMQLPHAPKDWVPHD